MSNDAYFFIGVFLMAGVFLRANRYENADPKHLKKYTVFFNSWCNFLLFLLTLFLFWMWGQP